MTLVDEDELRDELVAAARGVVATPELLVRARHGADRRRRRRRLTRSAAIVAAIAVTATGVGLLRTTASQDRPAAPVPIELGQAARWCTDAVAGAVPQTTWVLPTGFRPDRVVRCGLGDGRRVDHVQVAVSTGPIVGVLADLARPDTPTPPGVFCPVIALSQYRFVLVDAAGHTFVPRLPQGPCSPIYPSDASIAAARFRDLGTVPVALSP